MVATSGDCLLAPDAVDAVRTLLFPLASVVTPNLHEAARLLGEPVAEDLRAVERQATALLQLGAAAVLVKGGHGGGDTAVDVLATAAGVEHYARPRLATGNTHGTGCTLSAAITAFLARGVPLEGAVRRAKAYVWEALESGASLAIGTGCGPVDHLYDIRRRPPPA
jgi:hydroxymethylpyrimidine/phosphomethylpyrimidine kinase